MKNLFKQFVREESGQDLIEYVLLASFIAAGVVAGATVPRHPAERPGTAASAPGPEAEGQVPLTRRTRRRALGHLTTRRHRGGETDE